MNIKVYKVNAFTYKGRGGNPAGVVFYENLDETKMQTLANELNFSETAFIKKINATLYETRFFTPLSEVNLCGHATISSFYVLGRLGLIDGKETIKLKQKTKVGVLNVIVYFKNGSVNKVVMEQARPKFIKKINDFDNIANSLGINRSDISNLPIEIVSTGLSDIIIPVKNENILNRINPNYNKIIDLSKKEKVIGLHVFTFINDNEFNISARNFAPLVGINEESATGTSNGALLAYLRNNKIINYNKITVKQGEKLKSSSKVDCEIIDDIIMVGGECKIIKELTISI